MTDRTQDSWLTRRLLDFAEGGVRPVNAQAVAEGAIASGRRQGLLHDLSDAFWGRPRGPWSSARPLALRLTLVLVIVAALVTAAVAGGWFDRLLKPPPVLNHPIVEYLGTIGNAVAASGAARLADGRVLFVGGVEGGHGDATRHAWIFDPETNTLDATGDLADARTSPLLVTLSDGRVLVLGGYYQAQDNSDQVLSSAELYDPRTRTFAPIEGPGHPRQKCPCGALNGLPWAIPVANVLSDGRVFIAGGQAPNNRLADLFDPAKGTWSQLDVGCDASRGPQPLLKDGRVLVLCATRPASSRTGPVDVRARLFDARTNAFTDAATPPSAALVATVLPTGEVLLTGFTPMLYDPTNNAFEALDVALPPEPQKPFDIGGGRIVFLGFDDPENGYPTLLYDVASKSFSTVTQAGFGVRDAAAVRLADGRILAVGFGDTRILDPAQLP